MNRLLLVALGITGILAVGCPQDEAREDGAVMIAVEVGGSLQNPAWSPDGESLVCTQFLGGYNVEPADLLIVSLAQKTFQRLVSDGSANVNLPGSTWNGDTDQIVFSSSRDPHDEIFAITADGAPGSETRITDRAAWVAYEPSFSPDGQSVVFESHVLDVEDNGVIMRYRIDGTEDYIALTAAEDDCRQPNWSPQGDWILYQRYANGRWNLWVVHPDGTGARPVTTGSYDKTDASFSPDGGWLVYSSNEGDLEFANLYIIPVDGGMPERVTQYDNGYDGAPSWSPDGTRIAFESYPGDPDETSGTTLWMIDAPDLTR